jgi:cytosine/uracil/thiamine/allantoin permease
MNPGFLHSRPEDEIQRGRVLSLKCCYRVTGDYYLFEGIAIVAVAVLPCLLSPRLCKLSKAPHYP